MKIFKWIVFVPVAVDQFEHAEDYTIAKRTYLDCTDRGGIELQSVTPLNNQNEHKGYIAKRLYRCRDQIPSVIKWAVPKGFTSLLETLTSTFPKRVYHYKITAYPDIFDMSLESSAKAYKYGDQIEDDGNDTYYLDIINWDPIAKNQDWRIDNFECKEAGISKLPNLSKNNKYQIPEWVKTYKGPITMLTKIWKIKVNLFGIGGKLETILGTIVMPNVMAETHRAIVGWSAEWCKMDSNELKDFEEKSYNAVNKRLQQNHCE